MDLKDHFARRRDKSLPKHSNFSNENIAFKVFEEMISDHRDVYEHIILCYERWICTYDKKTTDYSHEYRVKGKTRSFFKKVAFFHTNFVFSWCSLLKSIFIVLWRILLKIRSRGKSIINKRRAEFNSSYHSSNMVHLTPKLLNRIRIMIIAWKS